MSPSPEAPFAPPVGPAVARGAGPVRVALDGLAGLCGGTAEEAARGVALGFWFGLLPKENATACLLGLAVAAVRLNLAAAAWAALVATALVPLLDPVLHRAGLALLSAPSVRGVLAPLLALPGGAWLGWDNTVTFAALLVGGGAAWPLHRGTLAAHRAFAPPLADWWTNARLGRARDAGRTADRLAGEVP
ncbi:DUF2062 domain-containing protein [Alienimonas californiensis]|uniref:DUF2062 domain-containing protein n=1 Tax=Alienimonas californiensis TaxID=2527989 RepID=A0A517PFT6_9PLAN|nr:hypothetical protein [Alienimonas californiensis]QDT18240.1 hypothetical protein CA12_43810 [Alienimonas californiensis]